MERAEEEMGKGGGWAHELGGAGEASAARRALALCGEGQHTPPKAQREDWLRDTNCSLTSEKRWSAAKWSGARAGNVRRNDAIRQKIIGHRMAVRGGGLGCGRFRGGAKDGAFALLDEPAGEHCGSVFLEPLVEEGSDLLAEIGGVGQAGELVALESVAGGGEKELPGRLSAVVGHGKLRWRYIPINISMCTVKSCEITSNSRVARLWISVEGEEKWRACSGCAGDYEDPDRSAWEEADEVDEVEEVEEKREGE